jgi:hypothetical protein
LASGSSDEEEALAEEKEKPRPCISDETRAKGEDSRWSICWEDEEEEDGSRGVRRDGVLDGRALLSEKVGEGWCCEEGVVGTGGRAEESESSSSRR